MKNLFLLIPILFLTACFNDPYDKYVGYWQSEKNKQILEVKKEDKNTYIALSGIDVLNDEDRKKVSDKPRKEIVLEKIADDRLAIMNNFAGATVPLNLSDDGKVLRLVDEKFIKIDEKEAKQVIKCFGLEKEYRMKRRDLNIFSKEHKANLAKLDAEYESLKKEIPNCAW
ncbi:hypothetical protein [Acinetobacter faecalis]|uniref:hypothetical protein n=1 Tax=Acinetobacter faecalis TaxID=2665161 RepID=UPI002A915240|nr:hypothetical protein [Acinetobacter faecalis]MDY6458113.1 hypothetical protein [Acinetobacter faecalis]